MLTFYSFYVFSLIKFYINMYVCNFLQYANKYYFYRHESINKDNFM